jgi:quinol monooxygenase YgiN
MKKKTKSRAAFYTIKGVSRRDLLNKFWHLAGSFMAAPALLPFIQINHANAQSEGNEKMDEILGIARMKIIDGKLEEFKSISKKARDIVRTEEGTLQYDLYLNKLGTEALVVERYRDEAALMAHHENMNQGGVSEAIMKTCTAEGELLGNISDNLAKALEGGPVRVMSLWQSL